MNLSPRLTGWLLLIGLALGMAGCSKRKDASKHLERAESYYQAGDYEKAKIEFLNVLSINRTNPVAMARIAGILYDQGSMLQALPALMQTKKVAPSNLESRARLAHALLSNNDVKRARDEVVSVLDSQPTNELALLLLAYSSQTEAQVRDSSARLEKLRPVAGNLPAFLVSQANILLRKSDFDGAFATLEKGVKLFPSYAPAHIALANLSLLRTNTAAAEKYFRAAAASASPRSLERLGLAEYFVQRGLRAEARAEVVAILAKAPDYIPAKLLLASLESSDQKPDEALRLVEEVLRVDPIHFDAQLMQAQLLLAQSKAGKAVEVLERLDKSFSPLSKVKLQLATAYLLDKKLAKARTAIDQAHAIDPGSIAIAQLKAQMDLRSGDAAKALQALQPVARQNPKVISIQVLLADALMANGRVNEAINIYKVMVNQSPTNATYWLALGFANRHSGRAADARQAFEQARTLNPKLSLATFQLAEMELLDRKYDKAVAQLNLLTAEDRKTAQALSMEGRILAAQKLWDQAEVILKRAIESDPTFTQSYFILTAIYSQSKQTGKAIEQLEALVKKADAGTANSAALIQLGMLYTEKDDYARARQAYEKLLAENPTFVPALNNLAFLYSEQFNLPDKAYELAQKARTLEPEDPMIADTLGWIFYQQRKYSEALPLLRESATKLRGSPEAAFHLGMAYYMLGEEAKAKAYLDFAVGPKAQFKGKDRAERAIAVLNQNPAQQKTQDLQAAVKANPEDLVLQFRLASKLEEERNYTSAAAVLETALSISPNATPALALLARLYAGPLKDRAKASALMDRAQKLASENPAISALAGRIAFDSGDHVKAYNLLREAATVVTNQATVIADLAWAAYSVGRESEAVGYMQRAVAMDSNFSGVNSAKWLITLVGAIYDPKKLPELEKSLGDLIASAPTQAPALMAQATLFSLRGQPQAATNACEKVLSIFPEFTPAKRLLAILYADIPGQEARATTLAEQARQLTPDDPDLTFALGRIAFRKKDFGGAVVFLQSAASRRPNTPEILYYLGMSLLQKGDKAKARQSLESSLTSGLKDPFAQEVKRQLTELRAREK